MTKRLAIDYKKLVRHNVPESLMAIIHRHVKVPIKSMREKIGEDGKPVPWHTALRLTKLQYEIFAADYLADGHSIKEVERFLIRLFVGDKTKRYQLQFKY